MVKSGPERAIHPARSAFTLVEILVVIGIIVILIGLLLPMVTRGYRNAGRMRAASDIQAIATAIEAYRQDFGDIPRIPIDVNGYAVPAGLPYPNVGAAVLCKALLGPYGDGKQGATPANDLSDPPQYQATVEYAAGDVFRDGADPNRMYVTLVPVQKGTNVATVANAFAVFNPLDGADGPGFRKRGNETIGYSGPVSPPYVSADKISFRGAFFLDHYGNPILYFPGSSRKRDITRSNIGGGKQPYVDVTPDNPGDAPPLFNAKDNLELFARHQQDGNRLPTETNDNLLLTRIRIMLGDYNSNGYIEAAPVGGGIPETAVTQPYLLWSAGPDGLFGPAGLTVMAPIADIQLPVVHQAVIKCDDVMNFRQ